jgi:uncharacterized protein YjcR
MSFEEMQSILQGILLSQQRFQSEIDEMKALANSNSQIVQSNGRAIQAMLDQAATDRLAHEERMQKHEERIQLLENISAGLVNLSTSIDEDRPTILRMLNAIERKTDAILNQLPPQGA